MNWDERTAIGYFKRLARKFGVTAEDRTQFLERVTRTARSIVPRRRRSSPTLEAVKKMLAESQTWNDVCAAVIPSYRELAPDKRATARKKLQANLRAHRSYYRHKRRSERQRRAKPHTA